MFHPEVVAARQHQLEAAFKAELPGGRLRRHPIDLCWAMRKHLEDAADAKGNLLRPLTQEETQFIQNETLLSTVDFRYWAERYAHITKETQDLEPITPLWRSQELFLARVAQTEYEHWQTHTPDGIIANVLKARQLGQSTLTQVIMAHGAVTQKSMRGLTAGDVQDQSQYMFSMAEQVIANLPWYLQPPVAKHQAGVFWRSATGSTLQAAWGKSSRGGLQDRDKAKGNLGRGRTYTRLHLSELSSWERPEQINDALLPGVPIRPRVFGVFESTAKGRHDWWHKHWLDTQKGLRVSGRKFINIFIPWYIEPDKYWLPVPEGWEPSAFSKQHAEAVERDSPQWCLGETYRLRREQLYWYETTRAAYESAGELYKHYEEYCSTPEESFQHAGRSVFSDATLERLKAQQRLPHALLRVRPASDIAQLKQWERQHGAGT